MKLDFSFKSYEAYFCLMRIRPRLNIEQFAEILFRIERSCEYKHSSDYRMAMRLSTRTRSTLQTAGGTTWGWLVINHVSVDFARKSMRTVKVELTDTHRRRPKTLLCCGPGTAGYFRSPRTSPSPQCAGGSDPCPCGTWKRQTWSKAVVSRAAALSSQRTHTDCFCWCAESECSPWSDRSSIPKYT